jgi:UDP-2-acetamido-3-amino-2,3-dideoxy-glucuronate N-acetyltransferase
MRLEVLVREGQLFVIPMSTSPNFLVHESSYIDEGVQIGADTRIWHFCHVLTGSVIGERCRIGQNVVIGPRAQIGNNVKIQNNVSIYEGVTLEDDVFCGPSMVFTNVLTPRSGTPRNSREDFLATHVERGASIGANATIVCGARIGKYALVGAGAVVTRDVPPYAVVYGNPAKHKGWACECGVVLTLSHDRAECTQCRRRYRLAAPQQLVSVAPDQKAA